MLRSLVGSEMCIRDRYRTKGRSIFISDSAPDSFPRWKGQWFYLYMEGADWADYFYSHFSRAEDGTMRSLKLGVEERAAIKILTEDCLHHSSLLISEASLQSHGLSDLGPEGKPTLIFNFNSSFHVFGENLCHFPYLSCSPSRSWKHFQEAGNRCLQNCGG